MDKHTNVQNREKKREIKDSTKTDRRRKNDNKKFSMRKSQWRKIMVKERGERERSIWDKEKQETEETKEKGYTENIIFSI